jgi:hypothetical protein
MTSRESFDASYRTPLTVATRVALEVIGRFKTKGTEGPVGQQAWRGINTPTLLHRGQKHAPPLLRFELTMRSACILQEEKAVKDEMSFESR